MRVVLVDDEAPARARLRALLTEHREVTVVGEADNADAARAAVSALRPDVIFLDIEMPAERGTDLAATLGEPRPFIVFATAYERFAIDAFQYDPSDYLLKPVTRQRLSATLDRLSDKLRVRRDEERELSAAVRAQAHLLPRALPAPDGFAVAAVTLPARGVGGDFYDAALVDGGLAFVLGDVAGKGMAAGLIASSVHARWQSALDRRDRDLSATMLALHKDVLASTEGSRYATVFHGVLEPGTGVVRYVNAGHPAGLIITPGGIARATLAPTAPAVGLLDTADFAAADCRLEPDETLLVVSDGVIEAHDEAGTEFDPSLLASLTARHHADVQTLADAVVDAVRRHRGTDQTQDDVTVLAVRRSG